MDTADAAVKSRKKPCRLANKKSESVNEGNSTSLVCHKTQQHMAMVQHILKTKDNAKTDTSQASNNPEKNNSENLKHNKVSREKDELLRRSVDCMEKLMVRWGKEDKENHRKEEDEMAKCQQQRTAVSKARQDEVKQKKRNEQTSQKKRGEGAIGNEAQRSKIWKDWIEMTNQPESDNDDIVEILNCRKIHGKFQMTILWESGEIQKGADPALVMRDNWELVKEFISEAIDKENEKDAPMLRELLRTMLVVTKELNDKDDKREREIEKLVRKLAATNKKEKHIEVPSKDNEIDLCAHSVTDLREENNPGYCREGYKLHGLQCRACKEKPKRMVERDDGSGMCFHPTASAPAHHCKNVENCKYVICHDCYAEKCNNGYGRRRLRGRM